MVKTRITCTLVELKMMASSLLPPLDHEPTWICDVSPQFHESGYWNNGTAPALEESTTSEDECMEELLPHTLSMH